TTVAAVELICAQQAGQPLAPLLERHNRDFTRSYQRWFQAVYQDKYEYLGEYDLMRLAFLLDLGLYYLGVVSQPFKMGPEAFQTPIFSNSPSMPFYYLIRLYSRRFARIAQNRRNGFESARRPTDPGLAVAGPSNGYSSGMTMKNMGRRFMFGGYTFAPVAARHVIKALMNWGWLELTEGWKTWFRNVPVRASIEEQLP